MREIKDAKDLDSGNLIYFKSHAQATYMSDGATVEDAIKVMQNKTEDLSLYAKKEEIGEKQDKNLYFNNVEAAVWVQDSTYSSFPFRCDLLCNGVTSTSFAEVVFNLMDAISGKYAPICETKDNIVSIWSENNTSITIPTIIVYK